ncbi:MAG: maleylpyruvate isomerase family mycothiol-dependent enzyme [Acidimicrobiales bacterium]
MPSPADPCRRIVAATTRRTERIVEALDGLDSDSLCAPSELPGWSRLTIACHLRFGAAALLRMTAAGLSGEETAYYPEGRMVQRPCTLVAEPGEHPHTVVRSLARLGGELDRLWRSIDDGAWNVELREPEDNPDLGTVPLSGLALLRLTEVEVHGSDLNVGLDDWSDSFVGAALPTRLGRLGVRRTNHRQFDDTLNGSWLLVAVDGPTYKVSVYGRTVESHPADPSSSATAVIEATSRDLLALLLGRSLQHPLRIGGNLEFGRAFSAAFPGP